MGHREPKQIEEGKDLSGGRHLSVRRFGTGSSGAVKLYHSGPRFLLAFELAMHTLAEGSRKQ